MSLFDCVPPLYCRHYQLLPSFDLCLMMWVCVPSHCGWFCFTLLPFPPLGQHIHGRIQRKKDCSSHHSTLSRASNVEERVKSNPVYVKRTTSHTTVMPRFDKR
ncbi:Hypothetical protein, putative [Bodo saltans]|uniref:Uncharacterized protein n=1 Tax=Bodo saltans TaxID=75058 RepID=A0A0S4IVL7_BODSA|nr:Hypothetical protein, putative [Bodo saltans]|eukprot:CUF57252.1 Hypothetical protein, putative [Bodo saltans]